MEEKKEHETKHEEVQKDSPASDGKEEAAATLDVDNAAESPEADSEVTDTEADTAPVDAELEEADAEEDAVAETPVETEEAQDTEKEGTASAEDEETDESEPEPEAQVDDAEGEDEPTDDEVEAVEVDEAQEEEEAEEAEATEEAEEAEEVEAAEEAEAAEEPVEEEAEPAEAAETDEDEAEEAGRTEAEVAEALEQFQDEFSIAELHRGDIVSGVVVQVNPENVLVDVGYKSDGVIPLSELDLAGDETPADILNPGDKILVYVLSVDGKDGGVLLSQTRARSERAWKDLEESFEEREIIEGKVVEEVKGGLVVDVGVRGFMPASHVERGYVADLSVYVGETVRMYVIELDRSKNRVILSQKEVLEEEYEELREETWATIEEGEVREGVVKGITNFGAFIDLGGVDGLLHVSEMSWGRVNHPSDVVSEGEKIKVKVLNVNREEEKISLGLKQILPNPWDDVADKYPVGSIVDGKVMRLAPFGAFVQLEPGVEGLVHISQLAEQHVHKPEEIVSEGDEIKVKVLRVQPEERRISLSLKEAQRDLRQARAIPEEDESKPETKEKDEAPAPSSDGVTIGEKFGDLLEQLGEDLRQEDEPEETPEPTEEEDEESTEEAAEEATEEEATEEADEAEEDEEEKEED